jgi:di/tricarboxylate transporter
MSNTCSAIHTYARGVGLAVLSSAYLSDRGEWLAGAICSAIALAFLLLFISELRR